jgi:hypothetical protein
MAAGATSPGGATAGTATGTSGSAAGRTASSYRLTGGESQNLQQYVGQRVEVTGSVAGSAGSSSSGGASTAGTTGASAAGSMSGSQAALRVVSVRPTGEKCSQ